MNDRDYQQEIAACATYGEAFLLAMRLPKRVQLQLADEMYIDLPNHPRKETLAKLIVGGVWPVCAYSLACERPATTTVDCGPVVGVIGTCQPCADLYARLSGGGA